MQATFVCKARRRFSTASGFTLVELLVVVFTIGILAVVVRPELSASKPYALDRAVRALHSALTYARAQAALTGDLHGVQIDTGTRTLDVIKLPDSAGTLQVGVSLPGIGAGTGGSAVIVAHPITKRDYRVALSDLDEAVQLSASASFQGTCLNITELLFDQQGRVRCAGQTDVLLNTASLQINLSPHSRTLTLDGETGRVTIE
ncbi:MAG: type II secretion system protein [Pseudomonadota bacterium]